MTTYNTGSPVPSVDVRDLYDNAENLDNFSNGQLDAYADRLGVSRKSLAGMRTEFNAFLAASGFETTVLTYTDGVPLQVDRPTQLLERASAPGTLYSIKLPSTFPVVLSGTWATDVALLVVRVDSGLRQDLADPDGAGLSGFARTSTYLADTVGFIMQGHLGERVSLAEFGAVPGGDATAAFAAALIDLAGTDKVLYLPNASYVITGTIRLDGLNVTSDGCELLKDFDGVGIEVQGGADYFDFEGTLYIRGINAGFYDPVASPIAPANPNAHGVWFNSARIRIRGKIICQNHQGDLFRYTCAGNMNKTNIDACWGWWGNRGHYFEGTQDDFSVCELNLFSQFTWSSGIATSADFSGRNWKGYWYSEGGAIDGVSHGMNLQKLRSCELTIYCEQQNAALEIVLGAACTSNRIRSYRHNKDQDLGGAAARNAWIDGALSYNPGFTGDARTARPLVSGGDRVRAGTPGEYVEHLFLASSSSTSLGTVRGEGGVTSPYIKLVSASGAGVVALANDDFSVTVGGVQLLQYVATGITLGAGGFSLTGATNGKEVDATTTSLKSSRNSASARDHVEFYNTNGKVGSISTTASATAYTTTSDERLKTNIVDCESASAIIDGLRVAQYDWKVDGEHARYGVIAQEVESVYPEAVTPGEIYTVDYSRFVPLLIKELQELRARVKALES